MAPVLKKKTLEVVRMQSHFDDDFSFISNHWSISLYKSNSYYIYDFAPYSFTIARYKRINKIIVMFDDKKYNYVLHLDAW
jgi:hypothetical protein